LKRPDGIEQKSLGPLVQSRKTALFEKGPQSIAETTGSGNRVEFSLKSGEGENTGKTKGSRVIKKKDAIVRKGMPTKRQSRVAKNNKGKSMNRKTRCFGDGGRA